MPLGTVAESLALTSTAVFFGAALYISLVEHPARLEAGVDVALRQFPHSYRRAARLQASLAVITTAWIWAVITSKERLGRLMCGKASPFRFVIP